MKNSKVKNLARIMILTTLMMAIIAFGGALAFAEQTASTSEAVQTAQSASMDKGLGLIAAALSVGIAGIGSGIAVAAGAPAAIGALTEDATTFGKSLVFVAMGEGMALYGMLISILILAEL